MEKENESERAAKDQQILDIISGARRASLGTLTRDGAPQVTMTTVARTGACDLILLLSTLSSHTGNLARDERCSLLLVAPSDEIDPMAGPRLTLFGTVAKVDTSMDGALRQAYLARNPEAALYAGFGDFAIHVFRTEEAHLVAGFGSVRRTTRARLETVNG